MTHDGPPPATSYEKEHEATSDFAQSMNRLLDLLPPADSRQRPKKIFYKVEWDPDQPDRISDLVTMSAVATGARKEEFRGQFNQAQFRVTELSDEEETERFIWVRTGYQSTGTPITIDRHNLYEDFGYLQATAANIGFTMASHVRTIPDYLQLASEMDRFGAELPNNLHDKAARLLRQFAEGGNIASKLEIDTLPAFAKLLDFVGGQYGGRFRHTFLSNLLDVLDVGEYESANFDHAAAMLEAALREGVLPDRPAFMERVLVCHPIYEFPFAIELLHRTLQTRPEAHMSTHIFRSDRVPFAQKFISTVVSSRTSGKDDSRFKADKNVAVLAHFIQGTHEDQDLSIVGEASMQVLAQLRDADPALAEEQTRLDETCKDIVERILRPIIAGKLGKQTLRTAETDNKQP